jgi:Flp pilus assembly protein CpaB
MRWVETVKEELEEATILVAAEDMIAGEVITEDSVTSKPAIRSLLRLGAIPGEELPTILGRRLKISLDEGFPILRTFLQPDRNEMSKDGS